MVPNSETLRRAADLSDEIEAKQNELNQLLAGQVVVGNGGTSAPARVVKTASGRHFTPEAIAKIRAAQKRRWKNVRKNAAAAQAAVTAPATAPTPTVVPAPAPAAAAPAKVKGQLVAV